MLARLGGLWPDIDGRSDDSGRRGLANPTDGAAGCTLLVLISDGAPTDDYYAGLQKLLMSLGLERLFDSDAISIRCR